MNRALATALYQNPEFKKLTPHIDQTGALCLSHHDRIRSDDLHRAGACFLAEVIDVLSTLTAGAFTHGLREALVQACAPLSSHARAPDDRHSTPIADRTSDDDVARGRTSGTIRTASFRQP